jgi:hypothetical protein
MASARRSRHGRPKLPTRPRSWSDRRRTREGLSARRIAGQAARVDGPMVPILLRPGLKRLAAVVEEIAYPGLKLSAGPMKEARPAADGRKRRRCRTRESASIMQPLIERPGGGAALAAKARLSRSSRLGTHTRSTQPRLPAAQSSPPRPLWFCIVDMQSPGFSKGLGFSKVLARYTLRSFQ